MSNKRSIRFGPKPKDPFRRTFVDRLIYESASSTGPTSSCDWSWNASAPTIGGGGERFGKPGVRFYSERQAKVVNHGRHSPGPVHLPHSDFGAPPPLPDEHWLMKQSPFVAHLRTLTAERTAKLKAPLLGKEAERPATEGEKLTRPASRMSSPGRPESSESIRTLPRTQSRNPAATSLFPYANADVHGVAVPLPKILR